MVLDTDWLFFDSLSQEKALYAGERYRKFRVKVENYPTQGVPPIVLCLRSSLLDLHLYDFETLEHDELDRAESVLNDLEKLAAPLSLLRRLEQKSHWSSEEQKRKVEQKYTQRIVSSPSFPYIPRKISTFQSS